MSAEGRGPGEAEQPPAPFPEGQPRALCPAGTPAQPRGQQSGHPGPIPATQGPHAPPSGLRDSKLLQGSREAQAGSALAPAMSPHTPSPIDSQGGAAGTGKAGQSPGLTADTLPPAPQHDALGGAGAGVRGQGGAHAVLRVLAVASVILAPLGGKRAVRWEPAGEHHAHALRHAALTAVHKHSYTQPLHPCTRPPFIACALTHAAICMCLCTHTQQFPTGGVGLSRGRPLRAHPPCNTPLGPRRSGTSRTGSRSSSAGSTSARRSWLRKVQPLSGTAPLARPRGPLPRCPGWSRRRPRWDRPVPSLQGRRARCPSPLASSPDVVGGPVGVRASGRGHHPWISRPSAGSLSRLPPWAAVSQPQGSRKAAGGRPATPQPPSTSPGSPASPGPGPQQLSLTALDVEGAGVVQPVLLVLAARLDLPGVGKAGARGLHQPPGRLEVVPFQAVEVPAEA